MQIQPYLFFPGNCEEALAFYQATFGGTIGGLTRYGDVPPGAHPSPPELSQKIMHATLTAGDLVMMLSDSMSQIAGTDAERVALSLAPADVDEGRRLFDALAAGGTVNAPYEKQFWGATFGMVTDRFGIDWMINA